jgi:hypothetical protein
MAQLLERVKLTNSRAQLSKSFREQPQQDDYYGTRKAHNTTHHPYMQQQHGTPTALYYRMHQRLDTQQTASVNQTTMSRKTSRRQFILNKFNQIENTLHIVENGKPRSRINSEIMGEIRNIKQRLRL